MGWGGKGGSCPAGDQPEGKHCPGSANKQNRTSSGETDMRPEERHQGGQDKQKHNKSHLLGAKGQQPTQRVTCNGMESQRLGLGLMAPPSELPVSEIGLILSVERERQHWDNA